MTIINLWAVLAATVVGYLIMWIWHMPGVFGNIWAQEAKKFGIDCTDKKREKSMGRTLFSSFVITFVMTWTLAMVCSWAGVANATEGMRVGVILGTGLAAAVMVHHHLWWGSSVRMTFVSAGYYIPAFLVMGWVLGAWR